MGCTDWEGVCWEEGSFDRVMCDVPCSGLTVLVQMLLLLMMTVTMLMHVLTP